MEENNTNIVRNSLGEGHYEFTTSNGEKVEIRLVEYLNEMRWRSNYDGTKTYEPFETHSAEYSRQLDCYDVTITKNNSSVTKRCYLHLTYPRLELSNAMKDEDLAEIIESTFSPNRLEEREEEANKHDSTYLYLGGIDRNSDGELFRFRISPEDTEELIQVYESIRADERMETEFISYFSNPSVVEQLGQKFSQEEIAKAIQRLDEMKKNDLVNNTQKDQAKINPELSPNDASEPELAHIIDEATRQIHDDMTIDKEEPTIED